VKFGLFIAKQHPPGADMVERFRDHIEQVRAARDAGFDLVMTGQHYLTTPYQDMQSLPTLARLAAETGTMRIGAGVLLLPLLNPVDVAEQAATLDVITGGRFILGAGLGYREVEYEAFGVDPKHRVPRFLEALHVIERLFREDEVTHEGRFFNLTSASMTLKAVQQPRPPLWLAANNDKAVERAACLGDAWFLNPHAKLDVLSRQMTIYRRALEDAGKPFPAELPILKELYVAPDRQTAMRECRPFLGPKYEAYTAWGQADALPEDDDFEMEFEELVKDRFIVGDPDDCVRELRRYADELGVNTFVLRLQWPGMEQERVLRSIALLREHVLPALVS
jgi:alkanesulfonate monooxygenase SsuD/methylene tetrahydromethanopterin reductase-like flavin-dependent oxidoreductase (luciferase family)